MSPGDREALKVLAVRLQHVSATAELLADTREPTAIGMALDGIAHTIAEQTAILADIIRTAE